MRKFLFLIALAGLVSCGPVADLNEVELTGTLDNHQDGPVELNFFRDFINNDRKVISLDLDEDNAFMAHFKVNEAVMATLTTARGSLQVFLEPETPLHLEGDARQLSQVRFTGAGSAENNFLADYRNRLEPTIPRSLINEKVRDLEPAEFILFADSITGLKWRFFEDHIQHHALSPAFSRFFETQVHYEKFQLLLDYPSLHQRLNQKDALTVLPDHYYDFLDQATAFDGDRLNNLTYVNFLLAYLGHRRLVDEVDFPDGTSAHVANYHLAGKFLTGQTKYYMQALAVSREMNSGDLDMAMELFNEYMAISPVEDYKQRLQGELSRIESLWAGNPAPDFTMTDINGYEVSMSDYLGKVVYLKFWASWCGPCMREVPPAAELKKRMEGEEDLVFMYVSIDTDPIAWANQVERHGITGIHTRTPGRERGVPAMYHVRWIPTFYIIGKDGQIYDHRPPRPSDGELLDEALKAALAAEV